jgi:hypothetical protein
MRSRESEEIALNGERLRKATFSRVGVIVDGVVSCGLHTYIGVDGVVVYADRRGAPWWWAGLLEDGMRCGGETFFACGEGRHTIRGGDDRAPKLQVRGLLNTTLGGEDVLSSALASMVSPYGRTFPSNAVGAYNKASAYVVLGGCHLVEVRDKIGRCWGRGASSGRRKASQRRSLRCCLHRRTAPRRQVYGWLSEK